MKIFYFFISIFFLYIHSLNAQTDGPAKLNGHYVTVPPSPTSFEFTKYGDIAVNEFKGMVSPSIPLYTYRAGNLSIPISMDYMGNGVKVVQLSSWTGINWNLNAGGVITRTINDRADELPDTQRIFYEEINDYPFTGDQQWLYTLAKSNNFYDTQFDEFNFRFLNYSGSFYLDSEDKFQLTSKESELKIESEGLFDGGNDTIVITTPDGTKYYFGGEFCEQTQVNPVPSGGYANIKGNTSYYLYLIEHPKGDYVQFHYGTDNTYDIWHSYSERLTRLPGNVQENYPYYPIMQYRFIEPGYSHSEQGYKLRVFNGRYLTGITSSRPNFEVFFNSSLATNQIPNSYHYHRILNNIQVFNSSSDGKEFEFNYDEPTSDRFFLTRIAQRGIEDGSSLINDYNFEYFDEHELPGRFSNAQDFMGYFNGHSENTTLLPLNASESFPNGANGINFADRRPSFDYAVTGALKKIIYPTKGYTLLEYEPNPYKKPVEPTVSLNVYNNLSEMGGNGYPEPDTDLFAVSHIGNYISLPGETADCLNEGQNVELNLHYTATGNYNHFYRLKVTITEMDSQDIVYEHTQVIPDSFEETMNESIPLEVYLEGGSCYSVSLALIMLQNTDAPVNAYLSFSYTDGYEPAPGIGIRIKKTSDYTGENELTTEKHYYYQSIMEYMNNFINYKKLDYSDLFYETIYIDACPCIDTDEIYGCNTTKSDQIPISVLTADTFNSPMARLYDSFSYPYVTISHGENFKNGGVEKKFMYRPKDTITVKVLLFNEMYPPPPSYSRSAGSNRDAFNGKLISEKYLMKSQFDFYIKKWKKYDYSINRDLYSWNSYMNIYHFMCNLSASVPLDEVTNNSQTPSDVLQEGLYAGFYRTFQNKIQLDTLAIIDYIDPLPVLNQEDDTNYRKIVNKTYYEYDQYVGLPSKITKTTSNLEELMVTKLYYPGSTSITPPSQTQLGFWNELHDSHRIAQPIQTEDYISQSNALHLLSASRTLYNKYTFYNRLLPASIEFSKNGNSFEEIASFIEYNNSGQLTLLSVKNHPDIEYSYNSYGNLISKTDNMGSSNIQQTTYSYDDLQRLIKITDPRGKETHFKYDSAGRLQNIKDHTENLLQSFEYNYRPH
ncbi:MAG TPA: RHS repeat domain-containing protein [Pricia sp.]|nr:RHS repeat domain-containing protein [Pricia sp.]